MAATLTRERFAGPEWVFERKLDGIRLVAFKSGRDVRLMTRNQLQRNDWYPSYVEAIAALAVRDAILDGEATGMWGDRGVASGYHLFDVLWLNGTDVTSLALEERRKLLCGVDRGRSRVHGMDFTRQASPPAIRTRARRQGCVRSHPRTLTSGALANYFAISPSFSS